MFRLTLLQLRIEGGGVDTNLRHIRKAIAEAAAGGAQVVLLPEASDAGWTHPSAREIAQPVPDGAFCLALREAARRHGLYVCGGLTERAESGVFNAAVLIDPRGQVILHHRKLNELEIGHECYDQGDRLGVVRTPLAVFGLMICADAFAPGQIVARTLGLMGAEVILSPAAWAVPADHDNTREPYGRLWLDNYQPVARDFQLWIAGASNVGELNAGPWAGRRCIGCSLVVGPDGQAALRGPYGWEAEALLPIDVEPRNRARTRAH